MIVLLIEREHTIKCCFCKHTHGYHIKTKEQLIINTHHMFYFMGRRINVNMFLQHFLGE